MSNVKIKIHDFFFSKFTNQFINTIYKETQDCKTLLDIGCGFNLGIKKTTTRMDRSVGIDTFAPSIEKAKIEKTHNEFIIDNIDNALCNISDKSFDVVIALDLIEHFTKEKGLWLISEMNRIAIKKIIIFTPNGFVSQSPFDNNPFQEHISGWEIKEMKEMGFQKIYGFGGYKKLRGERFTIKYKPRIIWKFIAFYSQLITFKKPKFSYSICCIKELR
jgi:hypothetical protein